MASIAHVGFGYWGSNLARNFAELGVLKMVVEPEHKAAQAATAAHKVPSTTFEHMLRDASVDGVSIASPAAMHFEHAKAALQAGKHVFVEKPLALDVPEAEELCTLAETSGLTLMVGHILQYHPIYMKLRDMVRAGDVGRLLYAYSNRLSLGKFRSEENVLWSFAPHDISMLLGLFDMEPLVVSAQGNVSYKKDVADLVTLQMHFPGGGSGHVFASWAHPFKEQKLVVIGDKAMAVFEDSEPDWNAKLKIYRHKIDASGAVPLPTKAEAEPIVIPHSEPLKAECMHFLECINMRRTPRTDGREGLRVLRTLDQAQRSLSDNLERQDLGNVGRTHV